LPRQQPHAGNSNDYDYVSADPIGNLDLNGAAKQRKILASSRDVRGYRMTVAVINRNARERSRGFVRIQIEIAPKGARGAVSSIATIGSRVEAYNFATGQKSVKIVNFFDTVVRGKVRTHTSILVRPGELYSFSGLLEWADGHKAHFFGAGRGPNQSVYGPR
jgi:hypothetical protein